MNRKILGYALTFVCLFLFVDQLDLSELSGSVSLINWPLLFFGVISLGFGYAFRILRWSTMLLPVQPTATFLSCTPAFLGSIALNNLLPLRAGDVVRILLFPKTMGISKAVAAGTLVLERAIDLFVLLAIWLFFLLWSIESSLLFVSSGLVYWLGFGAVAFVLTIVLLNSFGARPAKFLKRMVLFQRFVEAIEKALKELYCCFLNLANLTTVGILACMSCFVWVGETGLFFLIAQAVNLPLSFGDALFIMSFATLSTLLPSSPGYVGTFHLAVLTSVDLAVGVTDQIGVYAIVVHLALWVPTTIAGVIFLFFNPPILNALRKG